MITERIQLLAEREHVYMDFYGNELARSPVDAMLVIPGGGYSVVCADREGDPIALAYLAQGLNCFVLHYSVGAQILSPLDPLYEASRAMLYIRANAEKYNINPDRVFTVGFSAGGHLAASLATLWNDKELQARLGEPGDKVRPAGAVLCYAVISSEEYGHQDSFRKLLGNEAPSRQELDRFSLEKRVDKNSSPAFFMHTFDDPLVPVENALEMAISYKRAGINCEMHIYPHGPHGMALANSVTCMGNPELIDPPTARWVADSVVWMKSI